MTATTPLTEHMTRVTLHSPDFAWIDHQGPDQLVRLLLPPRPGADFDLPATERWWPEVQAMAEERRPIVRNYTIRRLDRRAHELDIDFVLHGDSGPASAWAERARPGDRIGLLSDGARYAPPADTDWQLLVGDETALPAIGAILDGLDPATPAVAVLEASDPDAADMLRERDRTTVVRLERSAGSGLAALAHLRGNGLPEGTPYAWVAGESTLATSVRRHLVGERGFEKDRVYFCGYWREGTVTGS
ncbi:siderophore-interacting protein [Nocardiopsis mangrovi]|uniref:Siderophore-interacting protein n=1 Tax=Nocardiopsis mangrovi TaxID=1179818 RepID=A0ABV9E319_9ACTN